MNPSEPLSLGIFNSNTSLSSYNFFSFHLLVNILIFLLSSNRTAVHSWTIYILCPLTNFSQSCVCVCMCMCGACAHTHTRACSGLLMLWGLSSDSHPLPPPSTEQICLSPPNLPISSCSSSQFWMLRVCNWYICIPLTVWVSEDRTYTQPQHLINSRSQ